MNPTPSVNSRDTVYIRTHLRYWQRIQTRMLSRRSIVVDAEAARRAVYIRNLITTTGQLRTTSNPLSPVAITRNDLSDR